MKNEIIINIDTDRQPIIQIGKPEGVIKPTTVEEAGRDILVDMSCLCEALITLIHAVDTIGVKKGSDSLRDCIKALEDGFIDSTYTTDVIIGDENVDNKSE